MQLDQTLHWHANTEDDEQAQHNSKNVRGCQPRNGSRANDDACASSETPPRGEVGRGAHGQRYGTQQKRQQESSKVGENHDASPKQRGVS